jgi:hypothetical protein
MSRRSPRAEELSAQWSISRRVEQNVRLMGEVMSAPRAAQTAIDARVDTAQVNFQGFDIFAALQPSQHLS